MFATRNKAGGNGFGILGAITGGAAALWGGLLAVLPRSRPAQRDSNESSAIGTHNAMPTRSHQLAREVDLQRRLI